VGKIANLAIFNDNFNVTATVVNGIYQHSDK
jgi:N-acetylglucosamine-6-phosphate deacetylase